MVKKKRPPKKEALLVRDHIRELQWRLLAVFALLVAAGVICFVYYHPILDILRAPLNQELHYTTPVGSFAFIMRVSLVGGMAVAIPAIIYNILMFVRPAFKKPLSRGMILLITLFSLTLAGLGILFAYYVIIPGALRFFGGFSVDGLSAMILADDYLSFVISALIIFMLIFQLPLIITLIDHMKRLSMKTLFKAERWVILGSLIAALLVPFAMDLTVSLLISLPIILLYNLSIAIVAIRHAMNKKSKKSVKKRTPPLPAVEETPAPAQQFATVSVSQTRSVKVVPPIDPKQAVIVKKPPVVATPKPNPQRRVLDISSYPINNSQVVDTRQAAKTAPLQKTASAPTFRATPRPAAKLVVPKRKIR